MKNSVLSIFHTLYNHLAMHLRRAFKAEESKFILLTGLQLTLVPMLMCFFVGLIFWFFVTLDYAFFEAQTLSRSGELRSVFIDFLAQQVLFYVPFMALFFVSLFFVGTYLATLLIRPFEVIGNYCTARYNGDRLTDYRPDLFSELKLLMRYSEFFFSYVENVEKNKKLDAATIPPFYTKIRGPIFEISFFVNFCLFMGIVALGVSFFVFSIASDFQEGLIALSMKGTQVSGQGNVIRSYLAVQSELLEVALTVSLVMMVLAYLALSYFLYYGISQAAFAVFATMRSFMKGNWDARVHLIGHGYLRTHTRAFNKYLDYLQRTYSSSSQVRRANADE